MPHPNQLFDDTSPQNLGTGEPDSTATQMQSCSYTITLSPDTPAMLELPHALPISVVQLAPPAIVAHPVVP